MTKLGTDRRLTAVELFAGGGGMAIGCHRAGFKHLALVEIDAHAVRTLRANAETLRGVLPELTLDTTDVRAFDYSQISEEVDLLAGGAPCQPFSLGGKHRGKADSRNLFPEVFRAQRALRPRAVFLENVRGLARKSFRPYLEYILAQLALPELEPLPGEDWPDHKRRLMEALVSGEEGYGPTYHVAFATLNCADYGVPQRRHRVFMVAIRSDLRIPFRWPKPTHSEDALLHSQDVTGEYWARHGLERPEGQARGTKHSHLHPNGLKPWVTVRDALAEVPEPSMGRPHPYHPNHVGVPGARSYPGHTGSALDEPAKTLKAGVHGVPGGENMLLRRDGTVRYFTVHEAALIQTFPAEYTFCGSRTEAMRQIGNAAPVKMCEVIAKEIAAILGSAAPTRNAPTAPPRVALLDERPLALV